MAEPKTHQELNKAAVMKYLDGQIDGMFDTNFYGKITIQFRGGSVVDVRMTDVVVSVEEMIATYRKDQSAPQSPQ